MFEQAQAVSESHGVDFKSVAIGVVLGGGISFLVGSLLAGKKQAKPDPENDYMAAKLKVGTGLSGTFRLDV